MSYGSGRVPEVEGTRPPALRDPTGFTYASRPYDRREPECATLAGEGEPGERMNRRTGVPIERTANGGSTFHGDVTSYSGTRAACNERFRNYSSAVHRRRASVRSLEREILYDSHTRAPVRPLCEEDSSRQLCQRLPMATVSVHERYKKVKLVREPSKDFLAKYRKGIYVIK